MALPMLSSAKPAYCLMFPTIWEGCDWFSEFEGADILEKVICVWNECATNPCPFKYFFSIR
jgi:hypothetical protein